jgi:hypothetical protein
MTSLLYPEGILCGNNRKYRRFTFMTQAYYRLPLDTE